jgi:DNA (cytosine-5)-methyltransferase 1
VLVGGPPCQGHSDFNNRTRHRDHKNALYSTMVRAAEVLVPQHILIENVPGAINDRGAVVQRTADALVELGYFVAIGVIDLSDLGVPQRRRRLVLMASRTHAVTPEDVVERHRRPPCDVGWAIQDLEALPDEQRTSLLDAVAQSAPATRKRIAYLFDNDLADLPDRERPDCHAGGGHSYKSIYGRLAWDKPSQTITTGFYSMCMGRYVHPSRRRTITAHEAARLQYIPDWFSFDGVRQRTALAHMIGNAVPSRLSYAVAVEWLR